MRIRNVRLTPLRIAAGVVALLLLTGVILYRIPSNEYVLIPDTAHPLTSLVRVQGAHPAKQGGTIYYVDVFERQANTLETLFPSLDSHATFLPASEIVPPGTTDAAVIAAEVRQMSMSQKIAAAVALRRLGYHVETRRNGVLVDVIDLGTPAAHKLQPADVIQAVDGMPTPTIPKLRAQLSRVTPGQAVTLQVLRGDKTLSFSVRTFALQQDPQRALIGFEPAQSASIRLPIRVSIDLGAVGGPSAGLAFALEVMEKLGKDVTHGHRVAATGEMELNGTVAPIGGVEQKTWGVREAGADVFLVPAGANAKTAERYAGPLKIIPVRSFAQALHALATLPPAQ
ncbi:MAG TPA: PDZ domain-containing protein [Gaiellaceae bacterium]|nr:PDZ domain-containing protein [Gaiellaceae bacterium]